MHCIQIYVFPSGASDSRLLEWPKCVALITEKLEEKVKGGASQLLTNDFSTTDVISKTASQIVLMETMKQYFKYRMMLCCESRRQVLFLFSDNSFLLWTSKLVKKINKNLAAEG